MLRSDVIKYHFKTKKARDVMVACLSFTREVHIEVYRYYMGF